MSSTNKTPHYDLSQFTGGDKPAWLSDYNSDMSKIDTGINVAQSAATSADGKANANTTAIGTLSNLSTNNKDNLVSAINEVDGKAETNASMISTIAGNVENKMNKDFSNAESGSLTADKINMSSIGLNYSFTETDTGATWVDGKKIYKKTIQVGTISANILKEVSVGITNFDSLVKMEGVAIAADRSSATPFPQNFTNINVMYNGSAAVCRYAITSDKIQIQANGFENQNIIITMYYTKSV